MLTAFSRAFGQLGDPAILKVLAKSLALTLLLFALAAAVIGWLLTGTNPCGLGPLNFSCEIDAGLGAVAAFTIGVIGFFADEVVEAVERRHYPAAAGRAVPLGRSLGMSLQSFLRILLWNLAALPFYILLLFTGVGAFLLFSLVNALALGRDLGEMVAARHHEGEALNRWLAATRLRRAALGLAATWLFLIPFANLLAPLLGAAAATHLFPRGRT
jgi:uncharacterized protein involved in cysteine biosynthesis